MMLSKEEITYKCHVSFKCNSLYLGRAKRSKMNPPIKVRTPANKTGGV